MRSRLVFAISSLVVGAAAQACSGGADAVRAPSLADDASPADAIATNLATSSMRGRAAATTVHIQATGQHFEELESRHPGERYLRNEYTLDKTRRPATGETRVAWTERLHTAPDQPFTVDFAFTETYDASAGAVQGVDSLTSGPRAAMPSSRVAATNKRELFSDPDRLVAMADRARKDARVAHGARLAARRDGDLDVVTIPADAASTPAPIELSFRHGDLVRASTLEDDPMYGDAAFEVTYEQYQDVTSDTTGAKARVPCLLTFRVAGRIVDIETRTDVTLDPETAPGAFSIPGDLATVPDSNLTAWGERSSELLLRTQYLGFPSFTEQLTANLVDLAPGVVFVVGGSHNSLVVEAGDHLVLVEAPLYEKHSLALLNAIAGRWPDKGVREVVNTHFHFDHAGGVRTVVASGATLVTGAANEAFFREVFGAAHTLVADRLALLGADVAAKVPIVTVPAAPASGVWLGDATRPVLVFDIPTVHTEGMVGVYLPNEKVLFEADLYSPFGTPSGPATREGLLMAQDLARAIEARGLAVERIAGAHGSVGTLHDLRVAAGLE
jgi:glyoxylase-like metal-dependent hydrolase (beta-lactamase superfamily II)